MGIRRLANHHSPRMMNINPNVHNEYEFAYCLLLPRYDIFVAFFLLLLLLADSTPPAASSVPLMVEHTIQ